MDKEDCIRLIQLYGSFKMLWDSKDLNHLNKSKREDCWRKIAKELNFPVPELKKKLDSLTGSYRREKSKEKRSMITGSGADEIYISKWFGYKYFDFMSNKNDTGITQEGGIQNSEPFFPAENTPSIQTTSISHNQEAISNEQEIGQTSQSSHQPAPSSQQPPRKKKRTVNTNAQNDSLDSMLKETFGIIEKTSISMSDSCAAFGNHIAHELRKYDPYTQSCVKNAFNIIIHEADMGKYQMYRPGYDTQQQYEQPGSNASTASTTSGENLQNTQSPAQTPDFNFEDSSII